ncbi:sugar ABC transporter permease [Bacillus timonensis]|nr:sugar ABC transporter permease [Bacillus timonensis]
MKKIGFKEYLFILPTILLIAVFSLWPVVQSLTYTLFDYKLNNQQKSGLYVNERFNFDLFNETQLYVSMLLSDDLSVITEPEDLQLAEGIIQRVDEIGEAYQDRKGVQKISTEEKETFQGLYKETKEGLTTLTKKYEMPNGENLLLLADDLNNSVIPSNFIGLKSYGKAFTDDRIGVALMNTFVFTVFSVFFELVLGLGLALIMNKAIFGQGLIRTTSLIPWAIPTAVAALMWSYLYDGSSGVVANIFQNIGLVSDSRDLLLSQSGAMFSTILADVWKTTPYMALLLLAGLQNISSSLYEAASMDGANKIQQFFKVTLPLLKPSILVALLFRTLDAFRVFDLIYVLTGGGPGGATETLSIYAYKAMFGQTNFGYGSVVVMVMFLSVAVIAIIFVKFLGANLMEKS